MAMRAHLGEVDYEAVNRLVPWSTLPVDLSVRLLRDDFHTPGGRAQRVREWHAWLDHHKPTLVRQSLPFTPEQLTVAQLRSHTWRLGRLGALGYPPISIAKVLKQDLHQIKRDYRNEWWSLEGRVRRSEQQFGFFSWHLWRHTDTPPVLHDPARDPRDYSSLGVSVSLWWEGGEQQHFESPALTESWEVIQLSDVPFRLRLGRHVLRSTGADLFPMSLDWYDDDDHHACSLSLDCDKPCVMPESNGCVVCQDAQGIKKYTFPDVQGVGSIGGKPVTFQGRFTHGWEAQVLPEGVLSTLFSRSLQQIDRSLAHGPVPTMSHWLSLQVRLSDGREVEGHLLPGLSADVWPLETPIVLPHASIVQTDGTVQPARVSLTVLERSADGVGRFRVSGPGFDQACAVMAGANPQRRFLTHQLWPLKDAQGFIQQSSSYGAPPQAASDAYLETTCAWLLWLVPASLILILVALIIVLAVVWHRAHRRRRLVFVRLPPS